MSEAGPSSQVAQESSEEPERPRKTRQHRSCDACRVRKVKCDRAPPDPTRPSTYDEVCSQCKTFHIPCRYDQQPRKRGPPNLYVKRMTEQATSVEEIPPAADIGNDPPAIIPADIIPPPPPEITFASTEDDYAYLFDLTSSTPFTLNPFDAVLPRDKLNQIIQLHFDYVYPLIPLIHRPTFLADIQRRREGQPNESEWIALVWSLMSCTLAQVPHLVTDSSRQEVRTLILSCYAKVKQFLVEDYTVCSLQRHAIMYYTVITAELLGYTNAAQQLFGGCVALALLHGYHHEATYFGLDPITTEMRRRTWWIMYTGDRSSASINSSPGLMIDENDVDTALPRAIDDEYITEIGYLEQPAGVTPILSGYCYICRLYKLTGVVLQKRLADRKNPPAGVALQMRLNEVKDISEQIRTLMNDCPADLSLNLDVNSPDGTAPWSFSPYNDVQQLILSLTTGNIPIKDAYLVQKSNIYVTQQLSRLILVQYHDDLVQMQKQSFASVLPVGLATRTPVPVSDLDNQKDDIVRDLLGILRVIPIRSIAVNTLPLVLKVRFVAATLMQTCFPDTGVVTERTQTAQSRLWSFLQTLSEIEAMYSLGNT